MRYEFGKNWSDFVVSSFSEDKLKNASSHMLGFLGSSSLEGKRFLDIGCGSGIHSLAAFLAGAESVTSFDFDGKSVEATKSIRNLYGDPKNWTVLEGSILDTKFISQLGQYDIVYSWGVLHHTGDMWTAIKAAHGLMNKNALFYIALYSKEVFVNPSPEYWLKLKRKYNRSGKTKRAIMEWLHAIRFFVWQDIRSNLKNIVILLFRLARKIPANLIPYQTLSLVGKILSLGKIQGLGEKFAYHLHYPHQLAICKNPFRYFSKSGRAKEGATRGRGMDFWTDLRDWLGGYPMEFAGNTETKNFCRENLGLEILNIQAGEACTEFLFCHLQEKENLSYLVPYKETVVMRGPFEKFGSVGWKLELPKEIMKKIKTERRSNRLLMVLESSVPLGWEIAAQSERELIAIREEGKGRHAVVDNFLYFSTSDNSSPFENKRTYEIGIIC